MLGIEICFVKTPNSRAELFPESCSLKQEEHFLELKKSITMLSDTLSSFTNAISVLSDLKNHFKN